MPIDRKKVLMLNSVPMALDELQMAPAVISAVVKKRGHKFDFKDINLHLYDICGRDQSLYSKKTNFLQGKDNLSASDPCIDQWQKWIVGCLEDIDILLVNVFSMFSQMPALRIINLCRFHRPDVKILIGGIGSHKKILGGRNDFNKDWIKSHFRDDSFEVFGKLLMANGLVDDWQSNVDTDILEKWLPQVPTFQPEKLIDFREYQLDSYDWIDGKKRIPMLGSHGCVRQCSFCDVIAHYPRYSFVEADILIKEIVDACQQTGVSQVQFMDSLVNGSMKNFQSLLKNLVQAKQNGWLPKDFSWSGTYICRPRSAALDQIHELLAPSGVDNLIIGVETGSDRVRFEMEKKFTNQDLMYELQAFQQRGISANLLFFPSWPTETRDDFQETLELFADISTYAHTGAVHGISLGTTGFSLLDGTPIDDRRDQIGLQPGPISWLWKCTSNPDLDFWESIRRRMLMADWCEHYGVRLADENRFRGYLAFNLEEYQGMISRYAGLPEPDLFCFDQDLARAAKQSVLKFTVINSCRYPVQVDLQIDQNLEHWICEPGSTDIQTTIVKEYVDDCDCLVSFRFPAQHRVEWQQYENGDYYSRQGIYIDKIFLDSKDITYWGWNSLVSQQLINSDVLPDDYHQHVNQRCVTQDTDLSWTIPSRSSLHKHLMNVTDPTSFERREQLNRLILSIVESYR